MEQPTSGATAAKKEATIRDLSEEILKGLASFRGTLSATFDRYPEDHGETTSARPQPSNILDEIIDNLVDCRNGVNDIHAFVTYSIIWKID